MGIVAKLINVALLATVKYFLTFPYALIIGLNYTQMLIAITIGGIAGFYFFYYFSNAVLAFYRKHNDKFLYIFRKISCSLFTKPGGKVRYAKKPVFSRRKRYIVRLKNSYGFWGIITMTPVLLSIPVGAFLLNKYYAKQKHIFTYMTISLVGWSIILCSIVRIFPSPF